MDIDVTALKSRVREKNLSLDLVVETIEAALLNLAKRGLRDEDIARLDLRYWEGGKVLDIDVPQRFSNLPR